MLAALQTYSKEIAGIFGVFLAFGLNQYLKAKARLVFGRRHAFISLAEEPLKDAGGNQILPRQTLRTSSTIIKNEGRESAKNIEIVFNYKPQSKNIWPVRYYEARDAGNSRWSIKFDSLASGEEINLEMFSVNIEIPDILTVRSEGQLASFVEFEFVKSIGHAAKSIRLLLVVLGTASSFYLLALVIQIISIGA